MSNVFTLEGIREELTKKYGTATLQTGNHTYVMPPMVKRPKAVREQVSALLGKLYETKKDEEGNEVEPTEDEMVAKLKEILAAIVTEGDPETLFEELKNEHGEDDFPTLMAVLEKWSVHTQPGEASGSGN